ncbi:MULTISPECIES: proteasome assembly chaperone family protein [unclassified Amycolatopsis]|uniref:proteasome assembly chaperone family protein n=1 Tax=unclassified Amycolatopsis TaxID=2618356 RepID=UPI002876930E|nr:MULTISPECIES: PAC2 family protein [unclassified Amycolatopsis]MDS0131849.1 PAC2 family protein [Amycolatopsis sp. 505]MDS0141413.1 PAC2 family protein [Amycolatopsis sp. CM201R]
MGLDPDDLYEVDSDVPDLTGAVLLHHFEGFMDAGSAGRLLAEHLLGGEHRVVARFDVDRLIDYRSRRPTMTYAVDHWEDYDAPELVVHLLHDADGTPFLLLSGPEPDHDWERFSAAVRNLVERWGVRLTAGFHGIPMGAPHTRPLGVTAHATRKDLVVDNQQLPNRLQVPGSLAALLEYRLGEWGHDAMGFAAHVPHYLAQSTYPAASLIVLDALSRATGLSLPEGELRAAADLADAEINRQVAESDEIADVVRALERQYDTFIEASDRGSLLAESVEHMPTAEELGSQFERFLAEQNGGDGPERG